MSVRPVVSTAKRQTGAWLGIPLAMATTAVLLLLAEGVTRLAGIHFPAILKADRRDSARGLWVYDHRKGWFHLPGSSGLSNLGGPDSGSVRINSLGLRGPEVPRAKPPGARRVLVLGDSFAFGVGVDEPHLFSTRLQERLRQESPSCEVVNMGVSGYSTDQELLLFEDLGTSMSPDVVILLATDNDFEANTLDFQYLRYYKPYFVLSGDGRPTLRGVPVPDLGPAQRARLWLGQNSNVWNALRSRHSAMPRVDAVFRLFEVATPRPSGEDPVEITAALVAEIDDLSKRAGARFVMVNTAHRGEDTALFQALRRRLRRRGVAFLRLEETFVRARSQAPGRHWDFERDAHWNVDAHELAAQVTFEELTRLGFSGARSAPPE